jgi:hypothetical protein
MIRGVHAMLYSSKANDLRDFIKDKLRLPFTDVGQGWLIFDLAEGDIGCHPTEGDPPSGTHSVSFYCDDLEKTVADLKSRGVTFDDAIADHGYGLVIHLTMPGGVKLQIYQPRYSKGPKAKPARKAAAARRPAKKAKKSSKAAKSKASKPAKKATRGKR